MNLVHYHADILYQHFREVKDQSLSPSSVPYITYESRDG